MAKVLKSLKGATITFNNQLTEYPIKGWTYNGNAVFVKSSSKEYTLEAFNFQGNGNTIVIRVASSHNPRLYYEYNNPQWKFSQDSVITSSVSNPVLKNFDFPGMNENREVIQWILANATIEGGVWEDINIIIKNPLTLMLGQPMTEKFYDYDLRVNAETVEIKEGEEEIEPEIPLAPTDLTGYTVSLPYNSNAPEGYGRFNVEFYFDSTFYDLLKVGYSCDGPCTEVDGWVNVDYSESPFVGGHSFLIEYGATFQFVGGTDVVNPRLIQWFVNNGATFTKTS